jgi:hypothetical protein
VLSYRYATSSDSGYARYSMTKGAAQQGLSALEGRRPFAPPFRYGCGRPQRLRTATHQHSRWSAWVWSPPPESNRRPHPYHGSAAKRRASQCLRSSRRTVGGEGMCSVADRLGGARLEWLRTLSVGGFAGDEEHSLHLADQAVVLGRLEAGVLEPSRGRPPAGGTGRWRFAAGRARTARPSAVLAAPGG